MKATAGCTPEVVFGMPGTSAQLARLRCCPGEHSPCSEKPSYPPGPPRPPTRCRRGLQPSWTARSTPRSCAPTRSPSASTLAIRLDRVPDGFGDEVPVDETDPKALRREWLRQLHLWADYSPEEVFALKAGALMLGGVLVALLIAVAVI
jgi:hypothetical protein